MAIDWEKLREKARQKDAATYKVASADFAQVKPLVSAPNLGAKQTEPQTSPAVISNSGVGIGYDPLAKSGLRRNADVAVGLDPYVADSSTGNRVSKTATGAAKSWAGDIINSLIVMGDNPTNPLMYGIGQYNKLVAPNLMRGADAVADKLSESGARDIADAKAGASKAGQVAVDVGSAGLQLAGDIGVGVATGGGALVPMALRSFGGGARQAEEFGASRGQQIAYGTLQAGASVLTEKLFNAGSVLSKAFGKGALDDVLQGATTKAINKFISSDVGKAVAQRVATGGLAALGEGFEEILQSALTPLFQKITYDPDAKSNAEDILYDGLVGAIVGGIAGGAGDVNAIAPNLTTAQQGTESPTISPESAPSTNTASHESAVAEQPAKPQAQASPIFPEGSLGAQIAGTKTDLPQGTGAASVGSQGGVGATKPTRFEINDQTDVDLDHLPEMSNKVVMTPQKQSGTLKTKLSNIYTRTVDTLNPIVKFSKATGDRTAMLAQNSVNAGGTVSHIVDGALVDMSGEKIGASLKEVASNIPKGQEADFWNYMMQRRNINRAVLDTNVIANFNSRQSARYVENIEAQHPEWKRTGDSIVKWITDFEQAWGVESGLINQEAFDQMKLKDPNYVPAQREFTDIEAALTGGEVGRKFVDNTSPVKKMEGSERDINNPLENIMRLVNTTVKTARYNQVGQSLLKTLRTNPAPQYAKIISEEQAKGHTGNNVVTVIENGQKQYIMINDVGLLEALNGLPKTTYTAPVLSSLTTGFKKITTQDNPLFGITNLARDLPTGYIYGSQWNPFSYLKGEAKAFGQIARGGEMYQKYKAVGGGMSSFFSSADAETAALNLNKTKNVFQKVGIGFNKFNSMIEEATRLNEFSAVFAKTGDVQKALAAANDVTVNFARGGDITKTVDRNGVAYLNASIQGLDKLGKAFMPDRVAKTLFTGVTGITLPTLILYLFNRENPYYDELSNRTKDNYFVIPNMFGERDDNGKAMTFFKLPKSRELGIIFGALAERIAREVDGEEDAFKGFGGALATNIAPANPLDSGVVGPLINLRSNKDFAGRTIVPQSMEDRSPHLQFDEKTSELTKFIAAYAAKVGIELSPKKMDYLIDSWTGVVGDFLLPATTKGANALSPLTNKFTADPRYSNQTIADFYEKKDEAARKANDKNFAEGLSETVTLEEKISSNYAKASKEMSELTKVSARAGIEKLTTDDRELLKGYGIDSTQKSQDIQEDIRTQQSKIASAAIGRGTRANEMELDINNSSIIANGVKKYQVEGMTEKEAYSVYKTIDALEPASGKSEVSTYQKVVAIGQQGLTSKQTTALVATLYTTHDEDGNIKKESLLPYLTTADRMRTLYLTTKDSDLINMTIPAEFSQNKIEYTLTDKEKKLFRETYTKTFNASVTNVSSAEAIKGQADRAYNAAKMAVIRSRNS